MTCKRLAAPGGSARKGNFRDLLAVQVGIGLSGPSGDSGLGGARAFTCPDVHPPFLPKTARIVFGKRLMG